MFSVDGRKQYRVSSEGARTTVFYRCNPEGAEHRPEHNKLMATRGKGPRESLEALNELRWPTRRGVGPYESGTSLTSQLR